MTTNQNYYSQTLVVQRMKDDYEDFSSKKKILDFSNCSTKLKYYDNSSRVVIGKRKDETGGVVTEESLD